MRTFFIIFLAFLGCTIPIKPVKENNISNTEPKILLEKDYAYWKMLDDYQQFKLILQMVSLSDGILRFQFVYSDSGYTEMDMILAMEDIKECVNEDGWKYYVAYENDLQIGTVLLQCMIQQNMMND